VQLFADRARLSQSTFRLTEANATAVAQVCRRLDGIPLAIELAAARVKAISVEQIAVRLDDGFRLLTGGSRTAQPRQQTLRATLDWSYNLLTEAERALLRRLSVFAGGWTLEAAEAVCGGDDERPTTNDQRSLTTEQRPTITDAPGVGRSSLVVRRDDVLDFLTALVEKSLVVYEEQGGESRYRLPETVRQYGRERLMEAGEAAALRACHLDHYVEFGERAGTELFGPDQVAWMDRLEAEDDNLRAALEWSIENGEAGLGLRLAGAIWRYWHTRRSLSEWRERLERLLSLPRAREPTLERARTLDGVAVMALRSGDHEAGRSLYEEMLAIGRELGDRWVIATAHNGVGDALRFLRDMDGAEARCREALEIARAMGDRWTIAFSLICLGLVAHTRGDLDQAHAAYIECLAIRSELGDRRSIAFSFNGLHWLSRHRRDLAAARVYAEKELATFKEVGDHRFVIEALGMAARLARDQGDYAAARAHCEDRLVMARRAPEGRGHAAAALECLGYVAYLEGDLEAAQELLARSLAMFREMDWQSGVARALMDLGDVALAHGDAQQAGPLLEEGLALSRERRSQDRISPRLSRELPDQEGIPWALYRLSRVAQREADWPRAEALARESLGLRSELGLDGYYECNAGCLESLGGVAAAQGQPECAVRLVAAAAALREEVGAPAPPIDRPELDRRETSLRETLGEQAFALAWAEGRAMTLEQSVACALKQPDKGQRTNDE
jgi:predicted ATPase